MNFSKETDLTQNTEAIKLEVGLNNDFTKSAINIENNLDEKLTQEEQLSKELEENNYVKEELEKQIPGSVKILNERYGIDEFYRYPIELLLSQVSQEDEQLPYGLVIFPKNDPNQAFDVLIPALKDLYKKTRGHYAIKVAESDSKFDLGRKFINLNNKYGEKNKIGFLFLVGHGVENGGGLKLGDYDSKITRDLSQLNNNVLWKEESESSSFKKINKEYIDKDAEIVLLSCSTGATKGLAETLAISIERKVTAPTIFVQLHNLDMKISYDDKDKIHFNPVFQNDQALTGTYDHKAQVSTEEERPNDYF